MQPAAPTPSCVSHTALPPLSYSQVNCYQHIRQLLLSRTDNLAIRVNVTSETAGSWRTAIQYLLYTEKAIRAFAECEGGFLLHVKDGDYYNPAVPPTSSWYSNETPEPKTPEEPTLTPIQAELSALLQQRIENGKSSNQVLQINIKNFHISSPSPVKDLRRVVESLCYDQKSILAYAFGKNPYVAYILINQGDMMDFSVEEHAQLVWNSCVKPTTRLGEMPEEILYHYQAPTPHALCTLLNNLSRLESQPDSRLVREQRRNIAALTIATLARHDGNFKTDASFNQGFLYAVQLADESWWQTVFPNLSPQGLRFLVLACFKTARDNRDAPLVRAKLCAALARLPADHAHFKNFAAALSVENPVSLTTREEVERARTNQTDEALIAWQVVEFLDSEAFRTLFSHPSESDQRKLLETLGSATSRYALESDAAGWQRLMATVNTLQENMRPVLLDSLSETVEMQYLLQLCLHPSAHKELVYKILFRFYGHPDEAACNRVFLRALCQSPSTQRTLVLEWILDYLKERSMGSLSIELYRALIELDRPFLAKHYTAFNRFGPSAPSIYLLPMAQEFLSLPGDPWPHLCELKRTCEQLTSVSEQDIASYTPAICALFPMLDLQAMILNALLQYNIEAAVPAHLQRAREETWQQAGQTLTSPGQLIDPAKRSQWIHSWNGHNIVLFLNGLALNPHLADKKSLISDCFFALLSQSQTKDTLARLFSSLSDAVYPYLDSGQWGALSTAQRCQVVSVLPDREKQTLAAIAATFAHKDETEQLQFIKALTPAKADCLKGIAGPLALFFYLLSGDFENNEREMQQIAASLNGDEQQRFLNLYEGLRCPQLASFVRALTPPVTETPTPFLHQLIVRSLESSEWTIPSLPTRLLQGISLNEETLKRLSPVYLHSLSPAFSPDTLARALDLDPLLLRNLPIEVLPRVVACTEDPEKCCFALGSLIGQDNYLNETFSQLESDPWKWRAFLGNSTPNFNWPEKLTPYPNCLNELRQYQTLASLEKWPKPNNAAVRLVVTTSGVKQQEDKETHLSSFKKALEFYLRRDNYRDALAVWNWVNPVAKNCLLATVRSSSPEGLARYLKVDDSSLLFIAILDDTARSNLIKAVGIMTPARKELVVTFYHRMTEGDCPSEILKTFSEFAAACNFNKETA